MHLQCLIMLIWLTLPIFLAPDIAFSQSYPVKPIRILAAEVGGGSEYTARILARVIAERLGQQMIIDNRGNLAIDIAAKAVPDGYTLLFYGTVVWLSPLMRKTSWDPLRDFSPISTAVTSPNVIVSHLSFTANSVKELIDSAKAKPGQLNYASGGSGSSSHLGPELFKAMAGINIVRIPYRGVGPAINALIGGEVQIMFSTTAAVSAQVKSNKLKALAITSAQPSALLPGVPTVASSGLPGYEFTNISGMFAPAKTAAAIINRLNQEMVSALHRADVKESLLKVSVEPLSSSPQQFMTTIKSEMVKMGKVIKEAGIREE